MIQFYPIGVIHSPFKDLEGMPIQPAAAGNAEGSIEIFKDFQAGLKDIDGFSHLILIYHFHQSNGYELEVIPFMDTEPRGVFATRAPKRPNAVGHSVVRLLSVEKGKLSVSGIDVLDGTPLIDIKPYVPYFDNSSNIRTGWLENKKDEVISKRSDDRFKK